MPRLVRRKAPLERLTEYLTPGDWLLWLSEEFETRDWDSKQFGTPLACGLHILFLTARANTASGGGKHDDVFGDDYSGTGWLSYIVCISQNLIFVYILIVTKATFVVHLLTYFSIANAWY